MFVLLIFFLLWAVLSSGVFLGFLIVLFLVYVGYMVLLGDNNYLVWAGGSIYECGFEYGMGGCGFSLQFYIIGFSFLLFDLEICLFTPLVGAMVFSSVSLKLASLFLLVLLIVFIYEILQGAFVW